ncbi:hypothetical protein [Gloeocapsopsis dulcis]|nr:hypothetical protein [Gloeocapsopsis dulcis]WNN87204.1 hypothetical protein P0S91_12720 [Gloeocapsopsis dulcis]
MFRGCWGRDIRPLYQPYGEYNLPLKINSAFRLTANGLIAIELNSEQQA